MSHLLVERDGHVVTLVMNRPAARNALDLQMLARLADAWQMIDGDDGIRVAILTGAGDAAFSAGADLDRLIGMVQGKRQPETDFDKRILDDFTIIYKGLMRSYDLVKPLIAAIRGFCIAGGTEILQTTDIRVASETARFAIAEVKHSLFPMGGSTVRLPRQIPYCRAMEILLTGEQFSAAEALQWGLINKVVPDGEVMKEARRYADVVSQNGPLAVQAVKRSVLAALGRPTADGLQSEHELGVPVAMSADAKEGTKAFKEKRRAVFQGR